MKKRDIILFSTADWKTPYWTNKQHMAREFSNLGHRVLYVESTGLRKPKFKSATDWRRILIRPFNALRGASMIDQKIWVLSPLSFPFNQGNEWIKKLNQLIIRWQINKFAKKNNFYDFIIWTYHPYILNIFNYCGDNNTIIYHCVDDLSAIPGVDKMSYDFEERKLLEKSAIVFTTSRTLEKKCNQVNGNTYYFSNVVDFSHFSKAHMRGEIPGDLGEIPEPRVLYMGALSEFKIDFTLMGDIIDRSPKCNFVFIGDEIEGQSSGILKKISSYSNVYFLGHKHYDLLPNYLRFFSVGLLIVKKNEYTNSMFPMKYFEYIASGLNVISNKHLKRGGPLLFAESADAISNLIVAAVKKGRMTYDESRCAVGENTWKKRMEFFYSAMKNSNISYEKE